MKAFTFQAPPNILFEAGASKKLAELVAGYGAKRVLLVTDKGVRNAGLTKNAEAGLVAGGCELTVFDDVEADPPSHIIERAVTLCRDKGIELVASIGGGSALDTAKLVAYLAKTPDRLDDIYGVGLAKGERLPLLLAPTTAGTGSEVTPIAIVTTPTSEKKGVVAPRLLPDWAILDPELTLGLPAHVTAATGIDAMVHAIEAYTSKHRKNPMSDQLARQALALLSANVRTVCADGSNLEARSQMLLGSMLAGMAFANSPVAAVHALAYPIGALFHVPHGLSNALVLTQVLRFNLPEAEGLYAELAPIVDPKSEGMSVSQRARLFVDAIAAICRDCNVPASLADVGIGKGDLKKLAEDAMKQTRLLVNNPREMSFDDALAIYTEAFGNRAGSQGTILGPFHLPDAPVLDAPFELPHRPDEPGDATRFYGRVTDVDGNPLQNANLDVWQADAEGRYSGFMPGPPEGNLRGQVRTDADGRYEVRTVVPGPYTIPLDGPTGRMTAAAEWSPWRPAHIHLIVSAEGHEPLVTQLFIDTSDHLHDDVASAVKDELIVHPAPSADEDGLLEFEYDFALAPARTPAVA